MLRGVFIEKKINILQKKLTPMPNTFSKPIAHETSPIWRTYEEPISLIAQADKASSIKPKEIKVKLRQDPTDPNSEQ
jgi:hypothetical protein